MTNDAPIFTPVLSPQEGTKAAIALFREVFEAEPGGVQCTPERVNVTDGHTDYSDGLALSIVLPHRAHLALRRREDRVVCLASPQTQEKIDIMDLDTIGPKGTPGEVAHWTPYITGVAWSLEYGGFENLPGLDAVLVSCVPLGGGLSSSAALECSAAVATDEVAHLGPARTVQESDDIGRARLVTNCTCTEDEIVGAPTGDMDQSASTRCREDHVLEPDCRDGSVTYAPFSLAVEGLALLVIGTKAKHSLDDGQYGARRAACERAAEILGVEFLANIAIEGLLGAPECLAATDGDDADELVKRTHHVVIKIDRARRLVALLQDGQPLRGEKLAEMGRLMDVSHESLCVDYERTHPKPDVTAKAACAVGAHRTRITGGGFGGLAITLVNADVAHDAAHAVAEAYQREDFSPPALLDVASAALAGRLA